MSRAQPPLAASIAVIVAIAVSGAGASGAPRSERPFDGAHAATNVPLAQLVGQLLMGAFTGTRPSAALLRRIEEGRLGSIILRSQNIASTSTLRSTIAELQNAARRGGQPALLIAVDQEGGSVKRLASAPPYESATEMGAAGTATADREGRATGNYLREIGVNIDLAPVVDVGISRNSFLGSRVFGRDAETVTRAGVHFAQGLEAAGVASTAKHFPGLGTARANTDDQDVTVTTSGRALMRGLAPFAAAVESGVRLVMVSSARYPALDAARLPALLSPTIVRGLLRHRLGFRGVVVTDTMGARSVVPFPGAPARAIRAGVDLLLYSASEDASASAYRVLARAARSGAISRRTLQSSHDRVIRLKSSLRRGRR